MVTLKDIANRLGVDVSTVSKVLQGAPIRVSAQKREEILRTAQELNYQPNAVARGLRLRRSGAIAMVVPTITNYLYPEIIGGAEDAAEEHRYLLFLVKQASVNPLEQLAGVVGQGRVDGLLFAEDAPEPGFFTRLRARNVPYISLNRIDEDRQYVALDDETAFGLQADYLASLGHRQIAFVAVTPESLVARSCREYFLAAAARHELDRESIPVVLCDFYGEDCEQVADRLLSMSPRPTAIATASIVVASRLVDILRERGVSVPLDISVIGYHESAGLSGRQADVTTVKLPSREQGRQAVVRLLSVIAGEPFTGEIVSAPATILERGTCCRPHG